MAQDLRLREAHVWVAGEEAAGLIVISEKEAQGVTESLLALIHSGGKKQVFPSHSSMLHVSNFWLPSTHFLCKRAKFSERMVPLQAQVGNKVTDPGHPAGEGKRNGSRPCRVREQERKAPSLLQL